MIALPRGCEEVEEEDQQQELTSGKEGEQTLIFCPLFLVLKLVDYCHI